MRGTVLLRRMDRRSVWPPGESGQERVRGGAAGNAGTPVPAVGGRTRCGAATRRNPPPSCRARGGTRRRRAFRRAEHRRMATPDRRPPHRGRRRSNPQDARRRRRPLRPKLLAVRPADRYCNMPAPPARSRTEPPRLERRRVEVAPDRIAGPAVSYSSHHYVAMCRALRLDAGQRRDGGSAGQLTVPPASADAAYALPRRRPAWRSHGGHRSKQRRSTRLISPPRSSSPCSCR